MPNKRCGRGLTADSYTHFNPPTRSAPLPPHSPTFVFQTCSAKKTKSFAQSNWHHWFFMCNEVAWAIFSVKKLVFHQCFAAAVTLVLRFMFAYVENFVCKINKQAIWLQLGMTILKPGASYLPGDICPLLRFHPPTKAISSLVTHPALTAIKQRQCAH
jgi:hypothetical protein